MTEPYYSDDLVTLYHGDCREIREWLAADVLVTDPPYGYSCTLDMATSRTTHTRKHGSRTATAPILGDQDTTLRDDVLAAWGGRPALVFGSWKRPHPPATRQVLVWDKGPSAGMGDLRIPWKPNHEQVYVLGKGFTGRRDSGILTGHRVVTWASRGRKHPNQKPVSLLVELLRKCPPGVVADPLAGSGSLGLAARELGRPAVLVELDESYCEIIVRRLQDQALDLDVRDVVGHEGSIAQTGAA